MRGTLVPPVEARTLGNPAGLRTVSANPKDYQAKGFNRRNVIPRTLQAALRCANVYTLAVAMRQPGAAIGRGRAEAFSAAAATVADTGSDHAEVSPDALMVRTR